MFGIRTYRQLFAVYFIIVAVVIGCGVLVGCKAGQVRKELDRQRLISEQVTAYHDFLDSIIRQLAGGDIDDGQALERIQAKADATPDNQDIVRRVQGIIDMADEQPVLLTLIQASDTFGAISAAHLETLADIEERLANAQDDDDATLAVVTAILSTVSTVVLGVPIAGVFGAKREQSGFAQGTYYGAGKVAQSIGLARKVDAGLEEIVTDDTRVAATTMRQSIATDPIVAAAVKRYKDGGETPAHKLANRVDPAPVVRNGIN